MDERIAIRKDIRQALAIRYMADQMYPSGRAPLRIFFEPIRKGTGTDDEEPVFGSSLVLKTFHHFQEKRNIFFA